MTFFLLIYSHIAALSLGIFIIEIIATRKNWVVDFWAIVLVSAAWPYTLWLIYRHEVRK